MDTADEILRLLDLKPHPEEGGFFVETYRAGDSLAAEALPGRYGGSRNVSTAIYYMLTPGQVSAMHQVASDEVFHFYMGDPVEMLQLDTKGSGRFVTIGTDLAAGMRPQVVVPAGTWQGSILLPGGSFALLGATVAPGFSFDDYVHGSRAELIEEFPAFAEAIRARTHE